jgi:hypothetical protein
MRLVKAHDRGKVSAHLVADELAKLRYEAHRNVRDGTVGPRCIVAWRRRPEARKDRPAGHHQFYTGVDRDRNCPSIPTISRGADMQALVDTFMGQFQRKIAEHGVAAGASDFDYGELGRWPESRTSRMRSSDDQGWTVLTPVLPTPDELHACHRRQQPPISKASASARPAESNEYRPGGLHLLARRALGGPSKAEPARWRRAAAKCSGAALI